MPRLPLLADCLIADHKFEMRHPSQVHRVSPDTPGESHAACTVVIGKP